MAFLKVVKTKAYFKRFQVKYRRRREGKTDYYARKRLVSQDKNKYNSPKYRLVVRFSNRDVTAQIVRAKIVGDEVIAAAYAHELKNYGVPVLVKNYAAAYATGLLVARRLLAKLGLGDKYQGNTAVNGEDYNVPHLDDGPAPFRALLDVGLHRTTTGSKLFAALKGAADGGIEIPHSERRFVGYKSEEKKLHADILRKHIFGQHVADFMKELKADDASTYERQFSQYIKAGIKPDDVEALWTKAHKAIRANPLPAKKEKKIVAAKRYSRTPLTLSQRKDRVRQKLASRAAKASAQTQ
jgi:large subunit ribosomal protein L5e